MSDLVLSRSWPFHLDYGSGGAPLIYIPLACIVGIEKGSYSAEIHVVGRAEPYHVRETAEEVKDIVDCYRIFEGAAERAQ